jgi:hypothetical protein
LKLIALLLALAAPAFADVNACFITDPTTQSTRAKVNPSSGGALQVYCVGGTCTGGGASSGGGGDGGYTVVIQGPGGDGGIAWGVTGTVTVSNFPASQPVTGPISVNITDAGSPLNVQGTLTCSGPMTDTQFRAAPLPGPLSVNITDAGSPLNVQGAVTVSGTVTTTPPSNASTNVAQFGSTNVSTGAGVGGAGIPRVTVSSDSSLAANQSVNVSQINAVTPLMGVGASGTGAQRVAALIHDGTTTAGVIVATTALKTDLSSVAGTATSTAAAGVLKVGIVGNANAAIDAANNASAPANVWVEGWQLQSGATATAGTSGQVGSPVASLDHVPYARLGGPVVVGLLARQHRRDAHAVSGGRRLRSEVLRDGHRDREHDRDRGPVPRAHGHRHELRHRHRVAVPIGCDRPAVRLPGKHGLEPVGVPLPDPARLACRERGLHHLHCDQHLHRSDDRLHRPVSLFDFFRSRHRRELSPRSSSRVVARPSISTPTATTSAFTRFSNGSRGCGASARRSRRR